MDTSINQPINEAKRDSDFRDLVEKLKEHVRVKLENINEPIFHTVVPTLFETYLDCFSPEERQQYNCRTCNDFFKNYGGLVTISRGKLFPLLWSLDTNTDNPTYNEINHRLHDKVIIGKIVGVFETDQDILGKPMSGGFEHFNLHYPERLRYKRKDVTPSQFSAMIRHNQQCLQLSVRTYSDKAVENALAAVKVANINGKEKFLDWLEWFYQIKKVGKSLRGTEFRNHLWLMAATAPEGWCKVCGSVIGSLLDDIIKKKNINQAISAFEAKLDPKRYQVTTKECTEGNIKQADELVEKLNLKTSFERRFARLDEIPKIWEPTGHSNDDNGDNEDGGFFSQKLRKKGEKLKINKSQTMTWVKFQRDVLPEAEKIQMYIPYSALNFCAFVTATNPNSEPIIVWDYPENRNPVSWYIYVGGVFPNQFGLEADTFIDVKAITTQPNQWSNNDVMIKAFGQGIFFALEDARDSAAPDLALFTELLRSELHSVRATITEFNKRGKLSGIEQGDAQGVLLQSNREYNIFLRVETKTTSTYYTIDRFE